MHLTRAVVMHHGNKRHNKLKPSAALEWFVSLSQPPVLFMQILKTDRSPITELERFVGKAVNVGIYESFT